MLGIGNILLRDEGIGVRVVEAMEGMELPADCEAVDGGTSGADLVDVVANRQKVIVVDAMRADEPPGTVFRMTLDDLITEAKDSVSIHEFGIVDTFTMAGHLGLMPQQVVVYGVQPGDISPGLELSAAVSGVIPRLIEEILKELRRD